MAIRSLARLDISSAFRSPCFGGVLALMRRDRLRAYIPCQHSGAVWVTALTSMTLVGMSGTGGADAAEMPVMPWARLEGPAFAAGPGNRNLSHGARLIPPGGRALTAAAPDRRRADDIGTSPESDLPCAWPSPSSKPSRPTWPGVVTRPASARDGGTLGLSVIDGASPSSARTSQPLRLMTACGGSGGHRGDRITRITDVEAAAFKIPHTY